MTRGFVRSSLYMTAGLLAWGAAFLATYVFAAIACARRFAHHAVVGLPVVHVAIALITAVAAGAAIAIGLQACRELRRLGRDRPSRAPTERETQRLEAFVALAGAVIGLIAILWNGIAALLVPGCRA